MADLQKWVRLSFLVCGIVAWLLLREVFTLVFDPIGLNRLDWVVSPADVTALLCGGILFFFLLRMEKPNVFLTEVLGELAKVTWPNRKETLLSTGVVAILVGIATFCILSFDSIWAWVAQTVLY